MMKCPECGCTSFILARYDFGKDKETGYLDVGTRAVCARCGFEADEADFQMQGKKRKGKKREKR